MTGYGGGKEEEDGATYVRISGLSKSHRQFILFYFTVDISDVFIFTICCLGWSVDLLNSRPFCDCSSRSAANLYHSVIDRRRDIQVGQSTKF